MRSFLFESKEENSEFRIVEILGDFEYLYGFEYNAACIATEWLYAKNHKLKLKTDIFGTVYSGIMDILVVPADFCEDRKLMQGILPKVLDLDKEGLLKFLSAIDLFYVENSKAQLIYTTHDTTLMDRKFFRRDQIWFVPKDEFGYSELVALSDYKVRTDASFEKDYLAGVYGGIHFLTDFVMKE